MSIGQKTKTPEGQVLWGFLALYGELFRLGCCCLFISAQPFAYVVANYTCYNRDKERYHVFHRAPPPFCWRFDSNPIISQYLLYFELFRHFLLFRRPRRRVSATQTGTCRRVPFSFQSRAHRSISFSFQSRTCRSVPFSL